MLTIKNNTFLRYVLFADAATCLITGLAMSVAGGFVAGMTELPQSLLLVAGISLLPFAGLLIYLGSRDEYAAGAFWFVIIVNILWTAASIFLIAGGLVSLNTFGTFFVILQALGVGVFAVLEYVGLRNSLSKSDQSSVSA